MKKYDKKSQEMYWVNYHNASGIGKHPETAKPSQFAKRAIRFFPKSNNLAILELGCGTGSDSAFFYRLGNKVLATDVANSLSKECMSLVNSKSDFSFRLLNILDINKIKGMMFDVVYAKGSLHYFSDNQLSKIFKDIYKILSPGGTFIFMGKSVLDPLYGVGIRTRLDKDLFMIDGRYRKYFRKEIISSLLVSAGFEIVSSRYKSGLLYSHKSNWLEVVTRK